VLETELIPGKGVGEGGRGGKGGRTAEDALRVRDRRFIDSGCDVEVSHRLHFGGADLD
jgi:hypothetical protein